MHQKARHFKCMHCHKVRAVNFRRHKLLPLLSFAVDDDWVRWLHNEFTTLFCFSLFSPLFFGLQKMTTVGALVVHSQQVHKEVLKRVPNAKEGRDSLDIQVYGASCMRACVCVCWLLGWFVRCREAIRNVRERVIGSTTAAAHG